MLVRWAFRRVRQSLPAIYLGNVSQELRNANMNIRKLICKLIGTRRSVRPRNQLEMYREQLYPFAKRLEQERKREEESYWKK